MLSSVFVIVLGLCYCSKESSQSLLGIPQLSGPSEVLVRGLVEMNCLLLTYPKDEMILLQLFKEGNRDKSLGDYTSLDGKPATFNLVARMSYEGNLECVASAQNNTNIEPTVSKVHHLRVIEKVKDAIIVDSSVTEFFEGQALKLHCQLKAGNHVFYQWLLNGRPVTQPTHNNTLSISRATSEHSGSYMCVATNSVNNEEFFTSNSSEVEITVKDLVSHPDISFKVLKEGSDYCARVTCKSTRGTPPITFSLYNGTEVFANRTVENTTTTFDVPLVLDQHMGFLECQASNGDRVAYSGQIPLEVVAVGGPVTIHFDYNVGDNYAVDGLSLYCKAEKGSHPKYQWFLNKTLLRDRGDFYRVEDQPPKQSLLLLPDVKSMAGTYHCEVSDSFDSTTAISSKRRYLDKEVLNRLPVLVVAVVFGCFTFLILLVSVCCWLGVVLRRRQYGEKSLWDLEMERVAPVFKGEPDVSEYNEDADVVNAAREDEFDLASLVSVDEWPQIAEEKKTLEDEPVEEP